MELKEVLESSLPLLKLGEAARIIHVHPNTLRKWSDNGFMRCYRLGPRKERMFTPAHLIEFLDDHRENLR